jgi:8-oxo-dGTP pyrophosphatase MutT (NUDIX family)
MIAVPKKASTVILLRGKKNTGFEVFLLRRHEKAASWAGNFVYPGGRVDPHDGQQDIALSCRGLSREKAQQVLGASVPPEEALAYWIAAIRELFEEAGVLFANNQTGNPFLLRNASEREKFLLYRESLQKGLLTISEMVQKERLRLALDQLYYYAHWITPEALPQRFDTRFFVACHPARQQASHDQKETTAGTWISPQQALEENLKGSAVLSPPTLKTLEDLSRFQRIEDVLSSVTKTKILPVLPIFKKVAEQRMLLFPWDPDYKTFQQDTVPGPLDHGKPSSPGDNTTRLLFREGRWLPYCRHRS